MSYVSAANLDDGLINDNLNGAGPLDVPDRPPRTFEDELKAREERLRLTRIRAAVWAGLVTVFVLGLAVVFGLKDKMAVWGWSGTLPRDAGLAASRVMNVAPVIVRLTPESSYMC